eukprot:gene34737-44924_t
MTHVLPVTVICSWAIHWEGNRMICLEARCWQPRKLLFANRVLKAFSPLRHTLFRRNISSWMNYTAPMICQSPFEWKDGILSTILKQCSEDERPAEKWILFDRQPDEIDAMWIESMNSIIMDDDNKILTLINGDRMNSAHELDEFSVRDAHKTSLRVASPATAGMISIEATELGWRTYTESWVTAKFKNNEERKAKRIEDRISKGLMPWAPTTMRLPRKLLHLRRRGQSEKVPVYLISIDAVFPAANTVLDYFVDMSKHDLIGWDAKGPSWRAVKSMTLHDMIVPTVDNSIQRNVLLVGATGTTAMEDCVGTELVLLRYLPDTHSFAVGSELLGGNRTTSSAVPDIGRRLLWRGPWKSVPKTNLVIFIDDFHMPKIISFESPFQPPLELVRLWIDYQGWYDRGKWSWKVILDSQVEAGTRFDCARTQSRFSLINLTCPSDCHVIRIFDAILQSKFVEYGNEIKQLSFNIASATLHVYKAGSADFLATPETFHYLFNIRDVAKVMQGILLACRSTVYSPDGMIRLWAHECQRVFSDRFLRTITNYEQRFRDILTATMTESMQKDWGAVMSDALDSKMGTRSRMISTMKTYLTTRTSGLHIVEEKLEDYT